MRNTGTVIANDVNRERLRSVAANLHRMGVHNTIISHLDGRHLPKHVGGFDRCLLDAPCSGLGVISRDPSVKVSKVLPSFVSSLSSLLVLLTCCCAPQSEADIKLCSHIQKELILAAIDCIDANSKSGGILVLRSSHPLFSSPLS